MQSSRRFKILNNVLLRKNYVSSVAINNSALNINEAELKEWKEIPGPPSLPIIGQMHHFLPGKLLADAKKLYENLHNLYGPIVRLDPLLGRPPTLFLYDPESIAYILRAENWSPKRPGFESMEYFRRYYNKTPEESNLPTGLTTNHADHWRSFRTTVNPVMLHTKIIRLYASQLDEVAKDMIQRLKRVRDENNRITKSFDTEMNLWALESIAVVALGGRLNCLNQELLEDSPAKRLIRCVHDIFRVVTQLDFKPNLWKYFATKTFKEGMKLYQEQQDLAKHFIQKSRKEFSLMKKPDDEKSVLEKLLEIDERTALIMASDLLLAGVDTAANTMTASLYLLAKNQDKQDKLRQELKFGESRKYLKACIKESIRMMPVVPGNARWTSKDYNILGYRIPKKTFVMFVHQHISTMETQFPKAKEYIPERWIEEGPLYYKNAHPFSFQPFGFGVRSCIGRRIAELEIESLLKHVILNFKVEWDGPPPEVNPTTINYITGPFHFIVKDV